MANILLLGAGLVGSAIARDLGERHEVLATDASPAALEGLDGVAGVRTQLLDCTDATALAAAAATADLVVNAVPGHLGFAVMEVLVAQGRLVADISFFPEDVLELDAAAKASGAVVISDIGVAPGLDNLILGHHDAHMEVKSFECLVGGLPLSREMPFQYKAPFSPADVVEEYLRPARLVENGREVVKPALSEPEYVEFEGVGTLEAFNTDGLHSLLRTMPHIPDMREKTLRYPGHRELMWSLREAGFLSEAPIEVDGQQVCPRKFTSALLFDRWKLTEDDDELTVMRVTVTGVEDQQEVTYVWDLQDRRDPATGFSSMARTTGYTCIAAAEALLQGLWSTAGISTGELIGREDCVFDSILGFLEERGVLLFKH